MKNLNPYYRKIMEGVVQVVILVCLIVVIILLSIDKIKIIGPIRKMDAEQPLEEFSDVMGRASIDANAHAPEVKASTASVFQKYINDESQEIPEDIQVVDVETEDLIMDVGSYAEDEEDDLPDDDRFTQAVSLEELTKIGSLLQNNNLDAIQEEETVQIIQKMQGTEMFSMMQASIEGASQKIAKLLDKSFADKNEFGSAKDNDDIDSFDIGNFI